MRVPDWRPRPANADRAARAQRGGGKSWPLELVVKRGYAVATAYYGEIWPDDPKVVGGLMPHLCPKPLAERAPALAPSAADLARALADAEVVVGDGPRAGVPGAVEVTSPDRIRARRVRALYLCGLQEGVFPRPGRPEPFLGDVERAELNAASGLRLALREDQLAVERFYFYAAVSRPTDVLALSWHAADDEAMRAAGDALYVRTAKAVYKFEKKAGVR